MMPDAVPVQRVMLTEPGAPVAATPHEPADAAAGLFTGSVEAQDRAAAFTSSFPVIETAEDQKG